jgi:UDP:flavonoid glycosyltransferase YjiC (YdhE family)
MNERGHKEMTVVLLPNAGFLSETTRMLAVYRELKKLGTPAILATHGGTYEGVLREAGTSWEEIPPKQTEEDCSRYLNVVCNPFRGHLFSKKNLREYVEGEITFLRNVGARVVLSGFTLSASLSARAVGASLVVTHLGSWIPPVLERGEFETSEHFDSVFPMSLLPSTLQNRLVGWLFPRLQRQAGVFKEVAKELGIEPVRGLFDLMLGDLVLVTDVPEILGIPEEDLEAWRPQDSHYRPDLRFCYVGAIFAKTFGHIPDEVVQFLDSNQPKVYVAMASTRVEYLRAVLETLEDMEVRAVAVTTVHGKRLESRANVLLCDFLPSHEVMQMCDAAIIHGGQGTVQTAIASGTPVVGLPLQPEQNVNLKIVERLGGGRTLSLKALRQGRLRQSLEEILRDPSFKGAMADLRERQGRRNGPAEAAERLTTLHSRGH